jgi:hypothetical protein
MAGSFPSAVSVNASWNSIKFGIGCLDQDFVGANLISIHAGTVYITPTLHRLKNKRFFRSSLCVSNR